MTLALIQILIMLAIAFALGYYIGSCNCRCVACNTEDASRWVEKHAPGASNVTNASSTTSHSKEDLTVIEGIGPAIAKHLNHAGIKNYQDVIDTAPEKIHTILEKAGNQFKMHDATTWAEQATLLRDGKMDEFEKLTAELKGGKRS